MQQNKYQSHERKHGNVWLNIWVGESAYSKGQIEVEGDTASGYRIIRRGSLAGSGWTGLVNIVLGDAGVFFEKRKDAENFALIMALHFSGDLADKRLLDPKIFNGHKSDRVSYSEERTNLFWSGVDTCDPCDGWRELDPENILEALPEMDDPLPRDEDYEFEDEERAYGISEAAESVLNYYAQWFLTPKVEISFHEIVAREIAVQDDGFFPVSKPDRGYVALLALAALRHEIPVSWIFPNQSSIVANLLPRLQASLPPDVKTYIREYHEEDLRRRNFAKKVEGLKAEILARLPEIDDWNSPDARPQIHCCASYFVRVSGGETEAPTHSDPKYQTLMKDFAAKALENKGAAIDWLATRLKKEHA
ncbi:hypothetical protein [Shimia thalassica]|uniref:hypothetical protein n=1 Tax=Shimia thalassica TaxID=1715693 RepID=UPI0026E20C5F|nr:hypothetical protein [Shimia thalassica]MDO6799206.1 hypothetical protein [Shimia thalassica]